MIVNFDKSKQQYCACDVFVYINLIHCIRPQKKCEPTDKIAIDVGVEK